MKNPLNKRLPRELKKGIAQYIVIFMFLTLIISLVSGFLVADKSIQKTFDESFEKYNIEDCNFETAGELQEDVFSDLEENKIKIYENFYTEQTLTGDKELRIYANRETVNLPCIFEGNLPEAENEIALDRLFAENNEYETGSSVEIGGEKFKVTGIVSLSDYSAMFKKNSDIMFDANNFGVALVSKEGFEKFGSEDIHYNYSYQFEEKSLSENDRREQSKEITQILSEKCIMLNYILREDNQSINFAGNDLGSDKQIFICLLYILVAVMAFVFAVIISHNIDKDSQVIGTLLSSGYTRWEIIRHYMTLPVGIALIGAVVGNILGYTIFKYSFADIYYHSYCFAKYETVWSSYAFVMTTIIPIIIIIMINFVMLYRKMSLSPLKFLRGDLKKNKSKRALRLPNFSFRLRFRIRVILQNMPNYFTLFLGMTSASLLLLFGCMMLPLINNYADEVKKQLICNYQYVLKMPVETENEQAEKFSLYSTKIGEEDGAHDDVSVYGIRTDSAYIKDISVTDESVYITNGIAEKYGVKKGDILTVRDGYTEDEYTFEVTGVYDYTGIMAIYTSENNFNETFDLEQGYFNAYFSNEELTDIDKEYVATIITEKDMLNMCNQLKDSMGGMFEMIKAVAVIIYMMLIYILIKIVIEKNAVNISLVKVFGYTDKEINKIYITATTIVVIISLIIGIPIADKIIELIWGQMMEKISGWIGYRVFAATYLQVLLAGLISYAVIVMLHIKRVKKVPMNLALKTRD